MAGRTSGQLEPGELITWEARHLGIRQRLTVQVTIAELPHHFRDEMRHGAFRSMSHDLLGRLVNRLFLTNYMTQFLRERNALLKKQAEAIGRTTC